MDFSAVIKTLIDSLKEQSPRPKVVNFYSEDPIVGAIENYINWSIYNNDSAIDIFANVAIDAKNAYDTKKKEEYAATLQPPTEF